MIVFLLLIGVAGVVVMVVFLLLIGVAGVFAATALLFCVTTVVLGVEGVPAPSGSLSNEDSILDSLGSSPVLRGVDLTLFGVGLAGVVFLVSPLLFMGFPSVAVPAAFLLAGVCVRLEDVFGLSLSLIDVESLLSPESSPGLGVVGTALLGVGLAGVAVPAALAWAGVCGAEGVCGLSSSLSDEESLPSLGSSSASGVVTVAVPLVGVSVEAALLGVFTGLRVAGRSSSSPEGVSTLSLEDAAVEAVAPGVTEEVAEGGVALVGEEEAPRGFAGDLGGKRLPGVTGVCGSKL